MSRCGYEDRPHAVPGGPFGGAGVGGGGGAAGDLHRTGDLFLPPASSAGRQDRGRQEGG